MIILGNLDCEARWSGGALPQRIARRVSAASALLAALAPEGEPVAIYAPAAVNAARIAIPDVTMRVGTPDRWDLAWADPGAKDVNDRRHVLALRDELGLALAGACVVTSLAALERCIATTPAGVPWVCKAPWTAAGRDRAHGSGSQITGELRTYIGRMLERFGGLVFEPWLDRVLDVGMCGHVDSGGSVRVEPAHTLLSSSRGAFVGIDLAPPPLVDSDRELAQRTADHCGHWLHRRGYAGPFAIDGFVYRDARGTHVLHALCELNARHTFGHVARALAIRFDTRVLGFGTPPAGARVLVAATEDDPIAAWVS